MGELLVDFITSLDGYASGEGWPGFWGLEGPEYLAWLGEQPEVTYLMGANTYRLMSGFAAGEVPAGQDEFTADEEASVDELTRASKVVFSASLPEPLTWANSTLVRDDAVEVVRTMKESARAHEHDRQRQPGQSLLRAGLVDRFRVVMFPVITGATGEERIYDGYPDVALEMTDHRTFDDSIQLVEYRPRVLETTALYCLKSPAPSTDTAQIERSVEASTGEVVATQPVAVAFRVQPPSWTRWWWWLHTTRGCRGPSGRHPRRSRGGGPRTSPARGRSPGTRSRGPGRPAPGAARGWRAGPLARGRGPCGRRRGRGGRRGRCRRAAGPPRPGSVRHRGSHSDPSRTDRSDRVPARARDPQVERIGEAAGDRAWRRPAVAGCAGFAVGWGSTSVARSVAVVRRGGRSAGDTSSATRVAVSRCSSAVGDASTVRPPVGRLVGGRRVVVGRRRVRVRARAGSSLPRRARVRPGGSRARGRPWRARAVGRRTDRDRR